MDVAAADTNIFMMTYKPSKLGQTNVFLVDNQSSSGSLCMQD